MTIKLLGLVFNYWYYGSDGKPFKTNVCFLLKVRRVSDLIFLLPKKVLNFNSKLMKVIDNSKKRTVQIH